MIRGKSKPRSWGNGAGAQASTIARGESYTRCRTPNARRVVALDSLKAVAGGGER
ncbi:hypothetical protein D9M68_655070 [compost metagenome]